MLGLESNDLGLVLVAVIGALTTLLGGQKIRDMRNATPAPEQAGETMELRGALISDKAAERIVQSSDAFTAAAMMLKTAIDRDVEAKGLLTKALNAAALSGERMVESGEANREVLRANTAAASAVSAEAHDLRDVIAVLAKELEFQSRVRGKPE